MEMIEDRAIATVSCAGSVVGTGLKEVIICPAGEVHSLNGLFVLDDQAAEEILRAYTEHATPVLVDWEHESTKPGTRAPAAGWVRKLWMDRMRGLRGLVDWTDKARQAIRNGEYKFLSPTLLIRKSDRRAVKLVSVGLVNQPAIGGLQELAASSRSTSLRKESTMPNEPSTKPSMEDVEKQQQLADQAMMKPLKRIRELLGMSTDNSFADVLEAAADRLANWLEEDGGDAEIASSVRERLGLAADAGKDEVVLAMSVTDTSSAAVELTQMREAEADRLAYERVDKYCEMNVINPNDKTQMNAALSLAKEDPERFEALMSRTPPYVAPGRTKAPTDRQMVAMKASREYRGDDEIQKTCSAEAWINQRLREAGMNTMSADEAREYVRI